MTVAMNEPATSSRPWWARLAAASGIAAILALTGFLYVATRPGDVALALKFSAGQTLRYRVGFSINGSVSNLAAPGLGISAGPSPYRLQVSETVSWRVRSVDSSGEATVEVSVIEGTVTVNGQTHPASAAAPVTVLQVAPDGRVVSAQDQGLIPGRGSGGGFPGLDQWTPVLPIRPVGPGARWSRAFDQALPPGPATLRYSTVNSFVRYQDASGIRTAVVSANVSVPVQVTVEPNRLGGAQASSPPPDGSGATPTVEYSGSSSWNQMAWVDPKAGALVRLATTGSVDMTMSFRNFPSLFPTFDPGDPAGSGLPFGGGPPGSSPGGGQQVLRFRGTLNVQMQRLG
jgi:hypothetical protein